ncbi:hypothetical protein [Aulosira sp. FACHB-615]|uniref:hypothetical protein n=1 Tax=Aulosira sp. FACHB-615 TaxID=2692777 RepID=UPI0016825E6F|nr:hypothetical protein [Aulosira sp. FACHB-615]MBD2488987.1 hypothetical protein [Aulosira sp. FACHB-615]
MSNQTLAAIIRRISTLENELTSAVEEIDESLEEREQEIFKPVTESLLSAANEVENSLRNFKTTFKEIPINRTFVTTGYGVWVKTSHYDALRTGTHGASTSDSFKPNTVVFTTEKHENPTNHNPSL